MAHIQIQWSNLLPFKKSEIEKLNEDGGVYRLSKKKEDGKFYVFYVGSAENIKNKLLHHLSTAEENIKLKEFLAQGGEFAFKYAKLSDKSTQEAIEKQLYKYYLPDLNFEEPKSTIDIEANIN